MWWDKGMADRTAPHVSMLWEDVDAAAALTQRFGFENSTTAAAWVTATLRDHWDLHVETCEAIVISDLNALAWVRTGHGAMIAKWSAARQRFARLDGLAELTAWLAPRGLPVSAPIPARDRRLQVERDGFSLGLQRVIPGDLLDVSDPTQVRAAGAMLARLHATLATYPRAVPGTPHQEHMLAETMDGWLRAQPAHVPDRARRALADGLDLVREHPLPVQLLHGDVRASNILWHDGQISALLDFEEARIAPRIDELARSSVLLGTRFHDWAPVSTQVRTDFVAGYESVRALRPAERNWWDVLVLWYSLAMIPRGQDVHGWAASALEHADLMLGAERPSAPSALRADPSDPTEETP